MDNLIGKNLGRYHVIEPLGQGGMASVYKAFDNSLERNVAIKIIRTDKKEGTEQDAFLKRFQREAKALAQLDHPYILKVLDYGEQEGTPYLIMPFVRGGTLKGKMGQPMAYREAAALLAPIAQALDYAHQRKIIHRDVKPANILISESNTPLLSDFGIAKILESGEATQLTSTGVGIGTPDYMAPEQWLGKADARTDIYSLGVVFFQMVTGRLPFTADTPAGVLLKHMHDPLPRPKTLVPDLPEAVEQVIYKALAKEPENRFQDMGAFAVSLVKLAQGDQTSLAAGSQDMETVLAGVPAGSALGLQETVRAAAVATPAKKVAGWKIGLIVVAIVAVAVFIFVVLAGGVYLASKVASRVKPATANPGGAESSQGISTPMGTRLSPTPSSSSKNPYFSGTPFQSIEGFPTDIPFLKENNGDLMTTTSTGVIMYNFTTSLPVEKVIDFYTSGMAANGWQEASTTTQATMHSIAFNKDTDRVVMINIVASKSDKVGVSIIIQQK
jgi:tRNA A-37 threonylcarbamoyl transferase component Bud32